MSAGAGAARASTFAALRGRDYRLYWLGLVCYALGQRAQDMTLAWITWEVSRDPMWLGYLGPAQGVPLVLFQLSGGVLADRGAPADLPAPAGGRVGAGRPRRPRRGAARYHGRAAGSAAGREVEE